MEETCNKDIWLFDCGSNNHIPGNKDLFSSLDSFNTYEIKLGNDYAVQSLGKGIFLVG